MADNVAHTIGSDEFPRPRNAAVMFVFQSQLIVWGGSTQVIVGEGDDRFLVDITLPGVYLYNIISI